MSETKAYKGGCHCGKVRYEVEGEIPQLTSCNCSICSKTGWLLFFVPEEKFRLLSGEEALSDYQFGKHHIHHLFCTGCGIRSFARGAGPDGKVMIAVNARCLDDVDLGVIPVKSFDGKSL
jgi:hypothetical protein